MKTLQMVILFFIASLSTGASAADLSSFDVLSSLDVSTVIGQVAGVQEAIQEGATSTFSMSNLWSLTEKAGPLRWPIFIVFVIGVFLVCFKLFEMIADQREARNIENLDFRTMSLQQIVRTISGQRESMMARLHAIMLNVFNSQQEQADLHDEISNFVRFQQDHFDTFRRRVDFLSDTAGALGLLGTVWGIFTVFSQGLLDDQVILTGMGFALITTLLGIIVSIVLNLSSTEVSSYFNRRLDRIAEKSDELRFRLMELAIRNDDTLMEGMPADAGLPAIQRPLAYSPSAPHPASSAKQMSAAELTPQPNARGSREPVSAKGSKETAQLKEDKEPVSHNGTKDKEPAQNLPEPMVAGPKVTANPNPRIETTISQEAKSIAQVEAVFQDRFSSNNYGDSSALPIRKPLIDSTEELRQVPSELVMVNPVREDTVGKQLKNMCFRLIDEEGDPIAGHQVEIKVSEGEGLLNDAQKQILLETDNNGEVRCDWQLAKKSGKQAISARVPGADSPGTRYTHGIITKPGVPRKLKQFGNNQGGAAGEPLAKPMKVQVLDEFENPISEWPVVFTIEMGGGAFDNGKTELKVKTNANGDGIVNLRVGNEPGFNTVKAAVEGVVKELKFQAMSMA